MKKTKAKLMQETRRKRKKLGLKEVCVLAHIDDIPIIKSHAKELMSKRIDNKVKTLKEYREDTILLQGLNGETVRVEGNKVISFCSVIKDDKSCTEIEMDNETVYAVIPKFAFARLYSAATK
jgi:hypothetical protein